MTFEQALRIVRSLIDNGIDRDLAIENPAVPAHFREPVRTLLEDEDNIYLQPARILSGDARREDWLRQIDRSLWHYWPTLRTYLLSTKGWDAASVRSLDEVTDRILGQLAQPEIDRFDIRGLVLGYVQSGKTANFTALAAKAADVGYRLVIVLSGIDNGLRRQTQIRLNKELVGYADNRPGAVRLPPMGRQWHQFTTEELNGDFRPGNANYGALQGTQPVLLVIKKNRSVLGRLHAWLDGAPDDVRRTLPVLVIDDEADQASVDTRGSYQTDDDTLQADYVPPSVINRMIRDLLRRFQRLVYVAYTATPFANILIPHDTFDPQVATDLYPRDFIVDLPKPRNYFGAEELFGRFDRATNDEVGGLDVIRNIPETDLDALDGGSIPETLQTALLDFVLAGAARAQRGQGDAPGTMLVHVSQIILEQFDIATRISQHFSEIRDEWRYHRTHGIRERLRIRWNHEFRPVVRAVHPDKDVRFEQVERFIGPFFESTAVRVINSATGEVLDYEREPNLKAVAVGGNRLSRGLTLEGLLISYFVRPTTMYDTLMQMGRWFGFRNGYEDLTRIYMPSELAGWFTDMALVEFELRQDIQIYESHDLTPLQLSARILRHPAMLVTSRAKQRFASSITVEQSYSASVEQTVRFPLSQPVSLGPLLENNLAATRMLVGQLSEPEASSAQKAVWLSVSPDVVLSFLRAYRVDSEVRNLSLPLICNYIERQRELGELTNWTISIRGRESEDTALGRIDLGSPGGPINLLARTRLKSDGDSLGVITTPGDEEEGLSTEQMERARLRQQEQDMGVNPAARRERPATDGLLLLYPISHLSGYALQPGASRRRLFDDPSASYAQDIIGLAISFPYSSQAQTITGQYMVGTVGWRPV